jgi:hypothetical protein
MLVGWASSPWPVWPALLAGPAPGCVQPLLGPPSRLRPLLGLGAPVGPAGRLVLAGLLPLAPAGPAGSPRPGWACCFSAPRLGQIRRIRLGRDSLQATTCWHRLGRLIVFRPGQAGIPGPGRITSMEGRDRHFWAGLLLSWMRFTPSGTYYSSSIASSASCQSWDASRLGLAYPSPSYAGLGTPLSSD